MTTLREYFNAAGTTANAFGKRIGKHRTTVARIADGTIGAVDRVTARRIFDETDGRVTPNDLYDIHPAPAGGAAKG